MPVNYLEIQSQVKEFGEKVAVRHEQLDSLRHKMLERLAYYSHRQDFLMAKVKRGVQANPGLRCAIPTDEALNAHFRAPPLKTGITILAADGSQITPSRHNQVEFCLINLGTIKIQTGSGFSPTEYTQTRLLNLDELYTPEGLITEGKIALIRDLNERQVLAQYAEKEPRSSITVTDGPLELYFERKETADYNRMLKEYLDVLERLFNAGAATAGYVDKPEGALVGRLLEVADLPDKDLELAGKWRPYTGIYDENLFKGVLLEPGERSAIFAIQSLSTQKFKDQLSLHFFYLNVGQNDRPYLARVEIPAWVAQDPTLLDSLHATLVTQSKILGSQPYPYALHRAHEVAVVSLAEKDQIEQMIASELIRQGIDPGQKSNKQFTKDATRKG